MLATVIIIIPATCRIDRILFCGCHPCRHRHSTTSTHWWKLLRCLFIPES